MFGITPYERNGLNSFFDFDKDFFGSPIARHFSTDIRDENDRYVLECEMPGFEKDDIKIDVNGGILTLFAQRDNSNDKERSGEYIRRERNFTSCRRSFDISNVNEDAIDASYSNGILKLVLPKKENEKPQTRQIEIK